MRKTKLQSDVNSLFNCVAGFEYIEKVGKSNDISDPENIGWTAKDSYEDSFLWASYWAGKIISDSFLMKR